jgi:hypothetical protein
MTIVRRGAFAPLLLLLVMMGVTGCADLLGGGGGDAFQRRKLAEARALWESRSAEAYQYDLDIVCACVPPEDLGTVRVTVSGTASTVEYIDTDRFGSQTPHPAYGDFDSIEALFDYIDTAIGRNRQLLQIRYHPDYGYPEQVNVIFSQTDQVIFTVTNFRVEAS